VTEKSVTMVKAPAAPKPIKKEATELVRVSVTDESETKIELSEEMLKFTRPYLRALNDIGGMKAAGAHSALECIRYLVLALQSQTPVQEFRRLGGHEAIDFLQCLETGRTHAFWKCGKKTDRARRKPRLVSWP
jgi:hypothetical protein